MQIYNAKNMPEMLMGLFYLVTAKITVGYALGVQILFLILIRQEYTMRQRMLHGVSYFSLGSGVASSSLTILSVIPAAVFLTSNS